jgi:DNA-directed RNA polymerase specialized sigma24 family protein
MVCVVPIDRMAVTSRTPVRMSPIASAAFRDRIPSLLAAARRLLDEKDAQDVVEEALRTAEALLLEFRAANPGVWLQGLVVGLSVSRARPRPRRHAPPADLRAGRDADEIGFARPGGGAQLR